jgi:hypothetical protein
MAKKMLKYLEKLILGLYPMYSILKFSYKIFRKLITYTNSLIGVLELPQENIRCKVCKVDVLSRNWKQHSVTQKHKYLELISLPQEFPTGEEIEFIHKPLKDSEGHDKPQKYENFTIQKGSSRFNPKFKTYEIEYEIVIQSPVFEINDLELAFTEMMEAVTKRTLLKEGDKIQLTIYNPNLHTRCISTPMQTFTGAEEPFFSLVEIITRIITSNEEVKLEDTKFMIKVISMPRGGRGKRITNLATDTATKRSIIRIPNNDNLCLLRAVVVALACKPKLFQLALTKLECAKQQVVTVKKSSRQIQRKLAIKLLSLCGFSEDNFEGTLSNVRQIEKTLGIEVNIVCAENFNAIIYPLNASDTELRVYLYKNGNHYDTITSMAGFLGSSYYCHEHRKHYNKKNQCSECKKKVKDSKRKVCNACAGPDHPADTIAFTETGKIAWVDCSSCFRYFVNNECFERHKHSACATIWKCPECKVLMRWKERTRETHRCGEFKCGNCKEYVMVNHNCFMQKRLAKGGLCEKDRGNPCRSSEKPKSGWCHSCNGYSEKYIYFDFETNQESGTHIVNYAHAKDFHGNSWSFSNIEEFCGWLFSEKHRGYTVIAHNAKAFDSQFILKYCIQNTMKPFTIRTGTKLTLLEIEALRLKVIDSLNFMQAPLKDLPKMFGIKELKKGWFPHYFNKNCNQNYVGPYPTKNLYGFAQMKAKEREEFIKWHDLKLKNQEVFDFKKEMQAYCESDVDILRRCCLKFREEYLSIANIDPFRYMTIASVCMAIYRDKCMPEKSIAYIQGKDKYSKIAISWLDFVGSTQRLYIQHAMTGGEYYIPVILNGKPKQLKVDGFCNKTNTVYQFHGCLFHGCLKCYKPNDISPFKKTTMLELNQKTCNS